MNALLDYNQVASTQHFSNTNALGSAASFSQPMNGDSEAVRIAWKKVMQELRDMRSLSDDWDGDGAVAPGVAVVDTALTQAIRLRSQYHNPPDRVIAGVNGSVLLEWFLFHRIEQMEIFAPNEFEVRIDGVLLPNNTDSRPIH